MDGGRPARAGVASRLHGAIRSVLGLVTPMGPAQRAHALRSVRIFRDASASDLVAVWERLTETRVQAGAWVVRRGDPGDRFYIVKSGYVEVRLGDAATGVPIRRLGPGDSFGEIALLTDQPRSADVVAVEDAVLWTLGRSDFDRLLSRRGALVRSMDRVLCEWVVELTRRIESAELGQWTRSERPVFGSYRVVEQVGPGGMAVVYSAVHVLRGTAVAVKVVPPLWSGVGELRARLEREALALRRVDHPNVIRVLEVGEVEARLGGGCFIVMEWLPHALDRVLRAQYPEPMPADAAVRVAISVAAALAAVHRADVVHRDVKPANIMFRSDGSTVLTDFGLATVISDSDAHKKLTPSNVVVGTADYLAPERVTGGPVDGRCDLYSLGVVLYEMLTGHVPFAGLPPLQTLEAHVHQPAPPLPDTVPEPLRVVVRRALAKSPHERFGSAGEMRQALEAASHAGLGEARRPT